MKIYASAGEISPALERPLVTLGNFDGVHRGHQFVIGEVLKRSAQTGRPALLVTFHPHPLKIIRPQSAPPLLISHQEKMARLTALGVEHALVIPFTPAFAALSAERFVRDVLHRDLEASAVFVGNNFNFGRGREGNVDLLRRMGRDLGFAVPELPDLLILGSPASSSRIRRAVRSGEVELARELLGRPFTVPGRVIRGDARGAALGYPTANLSPSAEILPADGVYVTRARAFGAEHDAVSNVGSRPTFEGAGFAIETHFLDRAPELSGLYDEWIEIAFLARLRSEVRFDSADQLKRQIAADVARARRFFEQLAPPVGG
jgi:riboflavin kinase/FMN adenylyltransferase